MTVLTTMACTITPAGINRPAFADLLETLQATFQSIYGSDAYIQPDSKDGQLLAAVAKAIDDMNAAMVAVYNGFSPATALGAALSNNVRINGINRAVATKSTVLMRVTGVQGTVIPADSIVADANSVQWLLPGGTIPAEGFLDMTAVAVIEGATEAALNTITQIQSPTRGWQTATNISEAAPGLPVESDAALRRRQAGSVALPALTVLEGIAAAIRALPGVGEVKAYENPTNAVDANGLVARSISMVVRGGDAMAIGDAIMRKKAPGIPTHGNTTVEVPSITGSTVSINFNIPVAIRIVVAITIKALPGYQVAYTDRIKLAVRDYINSLGSGRKVDHGRLYVPAQLNFTDPVKDTFEVDAITLARFGNALAAADVPILYNEVATSDVDDINVTVTA
jgi:uncharacterized phage protein gp47/JayE